MKDALRKFGIDRVYQVSEFGVDRTSCDKSENSHDLGATNGRISDSKPHEQFIDSSAVLGFEVPECGCHVDMRNFKSAALGIFSDT
jgi:hypothetical protein